MTRARRSEAVHADLAIKEQALARTAPPKTTPGQALKEVAEHRRHELTPLGPQLETLRQTRQQPWAAFRARVGLAGLPERFAEVVDRAVEIVDGVGDESGSRWHPTERRWR